MDAGAWQWFFENRLIEILALGMFHCAGDLAVFAANTSFWIDKHGFHTHLPYLRTRSKSTLWQIYKRVRSSLAKK